MSAPRVYGLLFGLSIAVAAPVDPASRAGGHVAAIALDETWTIPGAGSTAGQNNTFFVSDLALSNLGGSTANVTVSFVGPGNLPAKPITISAGATTVYRNVLDALWGATGLVGALSVRSDQPLVLRARTYNTAATGTFGVALPVYASGQLLAEAQTADSIWVQQDPTGTSGFRTNVGVVFPDESGGEALVTFYDAGGGVAGTLTYSSAAAGFQQKSVASVAPAGLPTGGAQISVIRGHAAGYAVGVDNVTGDTSIYPLEALPAGVQDVVVSGVARLSGRNNTFFRTDARLYNQTPNDVTVTVRFHAAGASNPTPQSATVTVPGGRIIEVVDVLGSILNAPVGSGGAVRFTADQPIAILCRTSNVDPQGVQPGTFGAQQRPVPLASFLSSADAGAVVTAIRQDTAFRTNIGFTAGPDGAAYRLTLKSALGASISTITATLGAFGWTQPSIADLFAGTAIPADATLLVEVTSGTVDVYDASLDNASGDLVVTPIAPVPGALPTSASIGPSGGSIRSADGRLTLRIPNGALPSPVTLSIASNTNGAPNAIGSAYSLSPVGVHFEVPAQIALNYSNQDIVGFGAGALGVASQDGTSWLAILGGSVDTVARKLVVPVTSTSPGPASSGSGRVPQRSSTTGTLGPYGSVTLSPSEYAVAEDDVVFFNLTYAGPSSTQSTTLGFVLLATGGLASNAITTWSVNGIPSGNAVVGTIRPTPSGIAADYTAPSCVPAINPVSVYVSVEIPHGPYTLVRAQIRIIPKRWFINVFYRSDQPCSGNIFSVNFCRSHQNGEFRIGNGGRIGSYLIGNFHDPRTEPTPWCPSFGGGCTQPVLSQIGDLNITDVAGFLDGRGVDGRGRNPTFELTISASVPGTGAFGTFTCGSHGTYTLPIVHGADPTVIEHVQIRYSSLRTVLRYPVFVGTEEYQVILIPISCDGTSPPTTMTCH